MGVHATPGVKQQSAVGGRRYRGVGPATEKQETRLEQESVHPRSHGMLLTAIGHLIKDLTQADAG